MSFSPFVVFRESVAVPASAPSNDFTGTSAVATARAVAGRLRDAGATRAEAVAARATSANFIASLRYDTATRLDQLSSSPSIPPGGQPIDPHFDPRRGLRRAP
jgi:hypothetical protein